jgi:hypothetical protein
MAAAWSHYLSPPDALDWGTVIARQKTLCYDGDKHVLSV